MTRPEMVARARSAIGYLTIYALGKGGFDPKKPHPGAHCDCSGFVAWVAGSPRKVPATLGWIETTRIVEDARFGHKLFREVHDPEPGDAIVYGDWRERNGRRHEGHVGILVEVPNADAGPLLWDLMRVVHCSSGNYRNTGDAIAETDARAFRGRAIFARWIGSDVIPAG